MDDKGIRIKAFSYNIKNFERPHILRDCTVVIDGYNFFYELYEKSGLPYYYGCDSKKYAQFVAKYLSMFKKAKVKCYFVFNGGHETFTCNKEKNGTVVKPIFMTCVYKQVLDEMKFDYVVCEFKSKRQCIALAQKLNCPIVSQDITFCFSGVPYIPKSSIHYVDSSKTIQCGMFNLEDFLKENKLSMESLATFVTLTNEKNDTFSEDVFEHLFVELGVPSNPFNRNTALLKWLATTDREKVFRSLSKYLNNYNLTIFIEEENKMRQFIGRKEPLGVAVKLFIDKELEFSERDLLWFEKGVALGCIPIQYIDLYHYNAMRASQCIHVSAKGAINISLPIIKYAFNLLTNYGREEFIFFNHRGQPQNINVTDETSVQKPPYDASLSPFENGWKEIRHLRLFEHFIEITMSSFNFTRLESLPGDARLLILALVYFSRLKSGDTICEVHSILLSYVMYAVAERNIDISIVKNRLQFLSPGPKLDPITDTQMVTKTDCSIAFKLLMEYKSVRGWKEMFRQDLVLPLVEFQHCFQHLNYLNRLCGSPYEPSVYRKTYNSTFVYKVLYEIKNKHSSIPIDFVTSKLRFAPTVFAFYNGILEVYNDLMDH